MPAKQPPHQCGTADQAEYSTEAHYALHKYYGTEPCGKSKVEANWRRAERRAGEPLPNWKPRELLRFDCGPAKDATAPTKSHYSWHKRTNVSSPICEKSRRELAWAEAEELHGKIENYQMKPPKRCPCPSGGTDYGTEWPPCGCQNQQEEPVIQNELFPEFESCALWSQPFEPNSKHYGWHKPKNRPPACAQAKAERSAYRWLKEHTTLEGWNYKPAVFEPREFICGGRDTAKYPDARHLNYHRNTKKDEPCGAAKEEAAWYAAENNAGRSLPNYQSSKNRDGHECSQVIPEVVEPTDQHYKWHKWDVARRGEPCLLAKAQNAAYAKEKRRKAGLPVSDKPYIPKGSETHICSDLEEAEYPFTGFVGQDKRAGREPCAMAKFASAWYYEQHKERKRTGNPDLLLLNWKRWTPPVYICGDVSEMENPSGAHYGWHKLNPDERGQPCGKSAAENAWARAEYIAGEAIPDYQYRSKKHKDGRAAVYRYVFADGGLYIGETKHPPTRRHKQLKEDSLLGEKLREAIAKNELFSWEVLKWFPTKKEAKAYERKLIKQGAPPGSYLLNITHKPYDNPDDRKKQLRSRKGSKKKRKRKRSVKAKAWKPPPHTCGSVDEMEKPSGAHFAWHHRNLEERGQPCGKSLAEAGWARAVKKNGGNPVNNYQHNFAPPQRDFICGTEDEMAEPTMKHDAWHRNNKKKRGKPCGKAKAEAAWARAEETAGEPLPDYIYQPLAQHICGEAEDATSPSSAHYSWHRRKPEERGEPCGKSIREHTWKGRKNSTEVFEPQQPVIYECGGKEDATGPSGAHYAWHKIKPEERGEPCDKAKAETCWLEAEKRAGHSLPDWKPWEPPTYECGPQSAVERPSKTHYAWHLRHKTTPCPLSRAEVAWSDAERRARKPLPNWKPRKLAHYECGTAKEATGPSNKHYNWHKKRRSPQCEKSRREYAWDKAEKYHDKQIENFQLTKPPKRCPCPETLTTAFKTRWPACSCQPVVT